PVHVIQPAALLGATAAPLSAAHSVTAAAAPNPAGGDPARVSPAPATLDWNAWLGPVPYRPYNPDYAHESYRWMMALGGGRLRGEGVHAFAGLLTAWGEAEPLSVRATASGVAQ